MKTMRKRIAGAAVAAVMGVTSTMTGLSGLTAGAANAVTSWGGGVQSDDVTLLVGEKSALRGATVAETLANANKTYVLGIASQFCIFLEDDFKSHDSDAEGRIAVGGGANLSPYIGWDYEVGKGDYNTGESLESLLGDSGYAHLIINNLYDILGCDDTQDLAFAVQDRDRILSVVLDCVDTIIDFLMVKHIWI